MGSSRSTCRLAAMSFSSPSAVGPLVSKVYSSPSREGRGFFKLSPFRGGVSPVFVGASGLCGAGAVRLRSRLGLVLGRFDDRREAGDVLTLAKPHDDHALRRPA